MKVWYWQKLCFSCLYPIFSIFSLRIVQKIREKYPEIKIIIRSDSGFSCAAFYEIVEKYNLLFVTGIASIDEFIKYQIYN